MLSCEEVCSHQIVAVAVMQMDGMHMHKHQRHVREGAETWTTGDAHLRPQAHLEPVLRLVRPGDGAAVPGCPHIRG